MTANEIRQAFLDFFRSKGHEVVPSAPIVVKNDPTLMFTNAGMNQFKDYFLGNKTPAHPRVADTQKCLRVSGKHNDLEEVGVDTYHHTMFEMLGNWSFGDYFKKEAIEWSWELLTEVYKLDKSRLYVTIFEGDAKEGLPRDEEAYNEWSKYVSKDRILMGNKKDNFWEMGDTGPCGPCTEIHYDTRPEANSDGHSLVNNDDTGMVMEIWNNVFIQFERFWNPEKGGATELRNWEEQNLDLQQSAIKKEQELFKIGRADKHRELTQLKDLPAKHVDTGMGLERLVRVIQGKVSNYDTDIFTGTIELIKAITKQSHDVFLQNSSKQSIAVRVIADHIRAIAFTIADGQLPSSSGAGYVIRRILRRAVRYYYTHFGYKQPLLCQLVPFLSDQFKNVFPELDKQQEFVSKVIKEEEEAFLRTLEKGLSRIAGIIDAFFSKERLDSGNSISGKESFELFDTYGFPIDLTRLIASENSMIVDETGFQKEMQQQKSRSRAATAVDAGDWIELKQGTNKFVGYDSLEIKTEVLKYRKVKAKGKELYQLVLKETPFYAESGGQVGDRGLLTIHDSPFTVIDTKKDNDLIIHFTEAIPADLSGEIIARVDPAKRKNTELHHSATHLLHAALRKVLGTHVAQKGSLVNEEHLRFDFSHFAKVTHEEMAAIEALVNQKIRENIPVVIKSMPKEEALRIGAMALFGEKYGDEVRVVIIDPAYSVELCGGTHVGATGELGLFKLISESAVAAGVRRVEAVCGKLAEDYINEQFALISSLKEQLKNPKDIRKSIENLQEENTELKKHLEVMEARQLVGIRNELLQKDEIINGVNFVGDIVEVTNADALKKLCYDLKNHLRDHVAVLCVNLGGKPFVAVGIAENVAAAKGLDAGKIIKEHIAPLIKGGGGGQKTLATAGGQDAGKLEEVIGAVRKLLQ